MTEGRDGDQREDGGKGPDAFRTISEVAEELGLPQHVLRFWETRFAQVKPIKRGGGRRYYRPTDVELLRGIKELLYGRGYTIRGVQRILKEQGGRKLAQAVGVGADDQPDVKTIAGPELYAPRREPDMAPLSPIEQSSPAPSHASAPVTVEPAEAQSQGLSERHVGQLTAVLDDLVACRRLLEGRN